MSGPRPRLAHLAWVVGMVFGVAACGAEDSPSTTPATERQRAEADSAPTGNVPSVSPNSQEQVLPPPCRDGDMLSVGRSAVDAATGSRYLRIDVLNCTTRPLALDRPTITGPSDTGTQERISLEPTPVANRSETEFTLAPGATASAGLEWLAVPREASLPELTIAASNDDRADSLPFDTLEMSPDSGLDYYPWVSSPDDVF